MEPIRPESGNPSRRRSGRGVRRTNVAHSTGFMERLENTTPEGSPTDDSIGSIESSPVTGDVEELLDAVHVAGEELLNHRTYTAAQHYRQAIGSFLRQVVPDSVEIQTHESVRGIMNRKRYYLLSEINRDVDRLVAGILQAQAEQIEILSRLKKIEGMLVDLMY